MKMQKYVMAGLLAGVASMTAGPVVAQAWPEQPVKFVVAFPPGGSADFITRVMAERLQERLGSPFIVENRPGGSMNLASSYVVRSPADGHTFLIGVQGAVAVNPSLYKLDFDPQKDLTPVSMLGRGAVAIVTGADSGINSLQDLVAKAKASPQSFQYATNGIGTIHHLSAELFKRAAGIELDNVPYKGTPGALQDVAGGRVDIGFLDMTASLPLIEAGRIKALATTGSTRSPILPNIPTVAESGYPGYDASSWIAVFGPKDVNPEIIGRLSNEIVAVLGEDEVISKGQSQGLEVEGSRPEYLRDYLASESARWAVVLKDANITVD